MKLEIGDKITLFEQDGFESAANCKIEHIDCEFIYIKSNLGRLKLPHKSVRKDIVLTTRANSLEKYKI